ncbi:MAG: DNA methyltransferase [Hyalangium sp.]|uniref:DNA methyltransferase n=1 Tax=Hyalangium sp. TaxID=2028555 RepID=UPI003899F588
MGKSGRHPIHSMCSYLGCFPPEVPRRVLEKYVPERGLVVDPFCGSGTTLVEAQLSKRKCIGVDLNPLAIAIATAKVQRVEVDAVKARLRELARGFGGDADTEAVPDDVRIIFHPRTLAQLVHLQGALDLSRPEDLFLRGALLGIMHGKHRKDGGTAYLSIDMPNTFSMSPEYVRKFVRRHRLHQPPVDVFVKLKERVEWLLRDGPLPEGSSAAVVQGDATRLADLLKRLEVEQVDAVVTSPPYLGVLRYGAFNWIRLWFLGYQPAAVDRTLDGTDSLDRYLAFMTSFLMGASKVLKQGAPLILVIGDVKEFGSEVRLAERVWEELKELVPFEFENLMEDRFDEGAKTTRIWGEERKGRATPMDRILVLRKKRGQAARSRTPVALVPRDSGR